MACAATFTLSPRKMCIRDRFGPLGNPLGGESIPWPALWNYTAVGWFYKVGVEVLFLPITYRVIAAVRRREPSPS